MRTLKKTLCLVLALVMMLGLCAVSASATNFTDDAKITDDYREALEIISALGIINGKDDGSYYDPQGTLTRVEGCYIISRVVKGETGTKASSRFKDVPAGSEAAVVDFMWSSGYADGYDDTTFGPNDTMLGSHFAKWLLTVLGYEAEAEGLTGDTFDGAVRLLTARNGLTKGIANYDQDAPITREAAAHMALNALQATMMEYKQKVTVNTDGTNVTVYGTATAVTSDSITDYAGGSGTTVQLCENYWPDLKLEVRNTLDETQLNTPVSRVWTYGGDELYTALAAPAITPYTSKVTAATVSSDLNGYYIVKSGVGDSDKSTREDRIAVNNATTYNNEKDVTTADIIIVNGAEEGALSTEDEVTVSSSGAFVLEGTDGSTLANAIASLTANGRVVEIFATDEEEPNRITNIVVTCYTLAKVDSITVSGTKTTYKLVEAYDNSGNVDFELEGVIYSDAPDDSTLFTNAPLAKGDIVTVTSSEKGTALEDVKTTLCVFVAEKHTGVQTNYDQRGNVTIDGKTYKVATGVAKDAEYKDEDDVLLASGFDFNNNSDDEADYYLDQFGYLVYSKSVSKATNYAFIVSATGKVDQGLDSNKPEITVRAVLVEGDDATVDTYTVAVAKKKVSEFTTAYFPTTTGGVYDSDTSLTDADDSLSANDELWVIKGTQIVVGAVKDSAELYQWGTGKKTTANAAQLLMSDIYGYVYKYTLKDKELTLEPLSGNGYTLDGDAEDTTYFGQTKDKIENNKQNYKTATDAAGDGKYYTQPVEDPESDDENDVEVVINASTPIVIFNDNNNTARVQKGVGGLNNNKSGVGYFVAGGVEDKAQLNAKIVFISTEKGMTTSTSGETLVYVSDIGYSTAGSGDNIVHTYDAWDQDGNVFKVHDGGDGDYVKDVHDAPGLYKVNADGLITDKVLVAGDVSGITAIDGDEPYFYMAESNADNNDMIDTGDIDADGNHFWSVANATKVIVKDKGDYKKDALILVFETVNHNELTGNVKTVFVVPDFDLGE